MCQDEACAICLNDLGQKKPDEKTNPESTCTYQCGHRFHTDCAIEWAQQQMISIYNEDLEKADDDIEWVLKQLSCPTCRQNTGFEHVKKTAFANSVASSLYFKQKTGDAVFFSDMTTTTILYSEKKSVGRTFLHSNRIIDDDAPDKVQDKDDLSKLLANLSFSMGVK